jgi:hypothetical protein
MSKKTINYIIQTGIIAVFLAFTGYLKLVVYYSYWDISISSFLEYDELIMSLFDEILLSIIFVGIYILHVVLGLSLVTRIDKGIAKENDKTLEDWNKNKRTTSESEPALIEEVGDVFLDFFEKKLIVGFTFFSLTAVIFTGLFLFFENYVLLYFSVFASMQLYVFLVEKIATKKPSVVGISTLILTFTHFILCLAYLDIQDTIDKGDTVKVSLYGEDGEPIDETSLYLGSTQKYHFLYDETKRTKIMIPVDQVIRFEEVELND